LTYFKLATYALYSIEQLNDICPSSQVFKNLDFTLDLLLLYRFEHFDDALLSKRNVYALEYFGILASAYLFHNFIWVLGAVSGLVSSEYIPIYG
jgi:hypothetical protein